MQEEHDGNHYSTRAPTPFGTHERDKAGRKLQATLLELVQLSLVGKQLRWSVTGPNFRPRHLQLDALVAVWRELTDAVAERTGNIFALAIRRRRGNREAPLRSVAVTRYSS